MDRVRIRGGTNYLVIGLMMLFLSAAEPLRAQMSKEFSFSTTVEKTMASVVSIEAIKIIKARDMRQFHLFRDFDDSEIDEDIPSIGGGSGFVVTKDGYILTNFHVVAGAHQLKVTFSNHKAYDAKIMGLDSLTDIALIKIDAKGLKPVKFADSEKAKIGDWVIALGNPLGLEATVTAGIISAKGRDINIVGRDLSASTRGYAVENFIQTDAVINPGNSGGPLINTSGEVVGINTAIASRTGVYAGYGFAIPSNLARHVMEDLMTYGEVKRGYIGINIGNVDEDLAEYLRLDGVKGVIVNNFVPGGAAESSDLEIGDVITHVDKKRVDRANELQAIIAGFGPDEKIILTVVRRGNTRKIPVTLKEREVQRKPITRSTERSVNKPRLGLLLEDRIKEQESWNPFGASRNNAALGVEVVGVKRRSAAAEKFIQKGSIIESLNNKPIHSVRDFRNELDKINEGDILLLRVTSRGNSRFVALRYWGE
ncbi:MAG: trypsin-like peptidase domain-containing protein [Candidatus Marinimicrobia bacterium]|nr:trypsin-like peptidase domain-containing protein [Candidatus Neomarinimicrobiota bacterium]